MKIDKVQFLILGTCMILFFVSTTAAMVVTPFPDVAFENAVREELGIPAPTPITDTDMLELTSLVAQDQGIVDLTQIGYAVNLTELYVSTNQIITLPAEIGNLHQLTHLHLSNNQLSSLPIEIGYLNHLEYLDLGYNQLNHLPREIGNLTYLLALGLYNNQLSLLPAEIGNLTNLKYLHLDTNQLSSLPVEIGNLTHLSLLFLSNNPLNTEVYCEIIPLIRNNNLYVQISYDPNPNPLTDDCSTNLSDLTAFSTHWLETDCGTDNNWCGGADLNHINNVDLEDVAIFCQYWLAELVP